MSNNTLETKITNAENGFPKLELAVAVPTESGNPFHNSLTGRFDWAPPGVNILTGGKLLKGLGTEARKILFARAKFAGANMLGAKMEGGKIQVVLLKDGRLMDSFSLQPEPPKDATKGKTGEGQRGAESALDSDPALRDQVLLAARDLSLTGAALKAYVDENLPGLEANKAVQIILDHRISDLVMYLHTKLLAREQGKTVNQVRIAVPRGYLRKTFANLEVADVQLVLERLASLGWDEEELHSGIVKGLPKRLGDSFGEPAKKGAEPDDKDSSSNS